MIFDVNYVSCGGQHIAIIYKNGMLELCGISNNGQTRPNKYYKDSKLLNTVKCGFNSTAFIF